MSNRIFIGKAFGIYNNTKLFTISCIWLKLNFMLKKTLVLFVIFMLINIRILLLSTLQNFHTFPKSAGMDDIQ